MKQLQVIKTPDQIERYYRKIQKKMRMLNNPEFYRGRKLTEKEIADLYEITGQWRALSWITGKYSVKEK